MSRIIKTVLVMVSIVFLLSSFTITNNENYSLTVEVENLRNFKGTVQITLYNKDGSIPDEHYKNYFKIGRAHV